MNSAEFKMTTDIQAVTPKSLDFNFEELKSFLAENLAVYKGLVVTEEQIKEASAIKARINKVASAIKEHRIAIKKEYERPYEYFKAQCDELEGMCKEVTGAIGKQLDAFEEARKAEKKKILLDYFNSQATEECKAYLDFEDIFDPKWCNKTFDAEDAKKAIDSKIKDTVSAVTAIRNLNSEFTTSLLEEYKRTHDLMACINKNKELTEIQQAEERRKADMLVESVVKEAEENIAEEKAKEPPKVEKSEELFSIAFRVICTETQLGKLKDFLITNGIKYGKV